MPIYRDDTLYFAIIEVRHMKRRFLAIIMAVLMVGTNSVPALGAEAQMELTTEEYITEEYITEEAAFLDEDEYLRIETSDGLSAGTTLYLGKEYTAYVYSWDTFSEIDEEVTWSSANTDILTFDTNGKINLIKCGDVTIVGNYGTGKSSSLELNVRPQKPELLTANFDPYKNDNSKCGVDLYWLWNDYVDYYKVFYGQYGQNSLTLAGTVDSSAKTEYGEGYYRIDDISCDKDATFKVVAYKDDKTSETIRVLWSNELQKNSLTKIEYVGLPDGAANNFNPRYHLQANHYDLNPPIMPDGYTFKEWVLVQGNKEEVRTWIDHIYGDFFLRAEYDIDPAYLYTINFDANGGSGTMEPQKAGAGQTVTLTKNAFTKGDSAFTGWNTEADGSGTKYNDEAEVKDLTEREDSITLYAQWSRTYTIKFDTNGGKGTMDPVVADSAEAVTLPEHTFTRQNYTFTGWNTKADGTGTAYADKATVTDIAPAGSKEVTLYAQWESNLCTITFDATGGTVSEETRKAEKNAVVGELPTAIRKSYKFLGWFTAAEGGTRITKETNVGDAAEVTYYAHWEGQEYIIYYNGNGGRGTMAASKTRCGVEFTLSKNQFVKDDKKFYGWNTAADGTGDFYGPEAKVKDLVTIKNGTIILYAQWKDKNDITVYFDGNGGTVTTKQKNVKVGAAYGVLPTATRSGYRFAGWLEGPEATELIKDSTIVSIKDDHTLYAKWAEEESVHIFAGETEVTEDEISIKAGSPAGTALTAAIVPSSAEQKVSWSSSNKSVATVSESGIVLGLKVGYAYIRATSVNEPLRTARVRVHVIDADPVRVDVSGNDVLRVSEEARYTAYVSPDNAPKETIWCIIKAWNDKGEAAENPSDFADIEDYSKNNTVTVTAKKAGKITLRAASAADENIYDEMEVEIRPETAEGIRIFVAEGYKDYIIVGEKTCLRAVISPASASQKVRWASNDEKIATVDKDGFVTGVSKGIAYIYAISEDSQAVRGSYRVRVNGPAPKIAYLTADGAPLTEAGTSVINGKGLTFIAYDEFGNEIPTGWSVENEDRTGNVTYATISGRGYFKAIMDDSFREPTFVRVIARAIEGPEEASALVKIIPAETDIKRIPAAKVYFDKKTATIYANGNTDNYINLGFLVHVIGKNDSEPTNPGLSWTSSNTSAANVDGCGIVTALSTGGKARATSTITAKTQDGSNKKVTFKIVVENRAVELKLVSASSSDSVYASSSANAEYEYKKIKLSPGKSFTVKGVITPSVTDTKVTFESLDPRIATVSSAGKITAKSVGTATILATGSEGSLIASLKVSVLSAAKSVKLSKKTLKLGIGNKYRLDAAVIPLSGSQKYTFTSENPDIARVDAATGLVAAISKGSTYIVCESYDGTKKAKCKVTVGNPIRKITITSKNDCVPEKKTLKLKAVFNGGEAKEMPINKQVVWSVLDGEGSGEALINPSTGVLTGISEGTVKVKVTCALDESVYAVSDYIMVYVPVKKATINKKAVTMKADEMFQLRVTITPNTKDPSKSATLKTGVRYSLKNAEDKAYVTVDAATGLITAKRKTDKPVVVVATYTPYGSKQKTLSCKVTVK